MRVGIHTDTHCTFVAHLVQLVQHGLAGLGGLLLRLLFSLAAGSQRLQLNKKICAGVKPCNLIIRVRRRWLDSLKSRKSGFVQQPVFQHQRAKIDERCKPKLRPCGQQRASAIFVQLSTIQLDGMVAWVERGSEGATRDKTPCITICTQSRNAVKFLSPPAPLRWSAARPGGGRPQTGPPADKKGGAAQTLTSFKRRRTAVTCCDAAPPVNMRTAALQGYVRLRHGYVGASMHIRGTTMHASASAQTRFRGSSKRA